MLDAESSGIRPTGSNARVRPQPSHLQSFSPVRLFSDTVLKPSPPEGVRGPCRCCDRESAEPPFPSKFQAFSPSLRPKHRPGAPCTGLQGISAVHQRASGKKLRFPEKRDFPDRMFLPPALPVQNLCTIPDDNRAPDQKLHHGNLPAGPKTVLIGSKQLPDFRNAAADAAEHAGTTHIADPDTPHSFPAFDLKASLYPPKCCNQAKTVFPARIIPTSPCKTAGAGSNRITVKHSAFPAAISIIRRTLTVIPDSFAVRNNSSTLIQVCIIQTRSA